MEQQQQENNISSETGYITLLSVIIIGVLSVAIASSLLLLGTTSVNTVLTTEKAEEAKAIAQACSEIARQNIASNSAFLGSGNLSLSNGTCSYTVASTSATVKTITASGDYKSTIRKSKATLTFNTASPAGVISSTVVEVSDF